MIQKRISKIALGKATVVRGAIFENFHDSNRKLMDDDQIKFKQCSVVELRAKVSRKLFDQANRD